MNENTNYLAALDLGSSKTRAIIAELTGNAKSGNHLRFLGFGETDSHGWNKGLISNLDEVTECVKQAVTEAEKAAGAPLESAVVGVGGPHVNGVSTSCGLTLSLRPRESGAFTGRGYRALRGRCAAGRHVRPCRIDSRRARAPGPAVAHPRHARRTGLS